MSRRRIVVAVLLASPCVSAAGWLDLTSPTYYVQSEYSASRRIARSGPHNAD